MVNGESDKKKGKRNVLFSQFSEDIAHSLCHEGKRFSLIGEWTVPGFFNIRTAVIATEIKIFFTAPLYDDLIGFNVAHCSFFLADKTDRILILCYYCALSPA